jgi:Methionyl-tRNA formyltransferase
MEKKIIILTGNELRHTFFRKYISTINDIKVDKTFCESSKGNLTEKVNSDKVENSLRVNHLKMREQVERDFFEIFCETIEDESNPCFIERGSINAKEIVLEITTLNPDLIISYGCSIIRSSLLKTFKGRFINIHLGISPYYRGSGTNFWPFVENELHFVGVTFMYIDENVDTGAVIHQLRARIFDGDNIHQIGNRLIGDMAKECVRLIINFEKLSKENPIHIDKQQEKYFRKKDFTERSLKTMYGNFSKGMIKNYLTDKKLIDNTFPIVTNSGLNR